MCYDGRGGESFRLAEICCCFCSLTLMKVLSFGIVYNRIQWVVTIITHTVKGNFKSGGSRRDGALKKMCLVYF